MKSFLCKRCAKQSKVSGIQQHDGIPYVVCEHCGTKNKLLQLPTPQGAPLQFEVAGIIDVNT